MSRMLLRPCLEIDEGPQGFSLRLAEANGLAIRELNALGFFFHEDTLQNWGCLEGAAAREGLGPYVKEIAQSIQMQRRAWNFRSARFCPTCLRETRRWHFSWELFFVDACPKHATWLVDRCSVCNDVIPWERMKLLHCRCGASLLSNQTASCPAAVCLLARVLAASVDKKFGENSLKALRQLSIDQLQRVVRLFGAYGAIQPERRPQKISNLDQMEVSWRVTSIAAEILGNWPNAFYQMLERMQEQRRDFGRGKMSGRFGHFYAVLYRAFPEKEFLFLRDAFADFIVAHWRGAISRRNTYLAPELLDRLAWMPANHACEMLKVSKRRLLWLIAEGRIAAEHSQGSSGRSFWVVRREDLKASFIEHSGDIDMKTAAQLLGLSKKRMAAIVVWLVPSAHKSGGAGYPWNVPRHVFDKFRDIEETQKKITLVGPNEVTLLHVFRYWKWSDRAIAFLLIAILAKYVHAIGIHTNARGVSGMVFFKHELKTWYQDSQLWPSNSISVPQAASELKVKEEVVYALVRNGFLQVEKVVMQRRRTSRVPAENIARFNGRFIFGRDLAASLDTSSTSLIRRLMNLNIYPVSGPTIDDCRQFLFEKNPSLFAAVELLRQSKLPHNIEHGMSGKIGPMLQNGI